MNGEEDFHVENTEETKKSQYGFCILLLDCDATRLVNQSEILRKCGYRVVATTRADELPFIIHNKDDKIDLVLAELCLVKMNKYELLEKIRSICEIPVVVAGANVKKAVILDCLCRGAEFCLTKPLMKCNLENLWQFIVRSQRDFFSQIDTKVHEREYSITHTQFLGDELNQKNKNSEVKKEDLDDYKGDNSESGEQKKPELTCPGMQKEFRETDDQLSQGQKRKERMDTDTGEHTRKDYDSALGDQKKPKLICADDLQNETLDSIPNTEEGENERKEPTEIQKNEEESVNYEFDGIKEQPELVCMEVELEKWSTQPVTDFASYVQYEFQEQDFQPLESVGESTGHLEIPLSPRESSNKNVVGQTHGHGELDEEVMQDGISLADLEFDLFEGHVSTSDLDKKATRDLFDEIFTDLANQLKP